MRRPCVNASTSTDSSTFPTNCTTSIPEQEIGVIIREDDGTRVMKSMRWGLIPFWADDPDETKYTPINVRAETIAEKHMFARAFKEHRCLVPASGFYEWKGPAGSKTPFYFHLKSRDLFAFPGIYETWNSEDGERTVYSVTFATTTPNKTVARVHNRMPVILSPEEEESWLNPDTDESELLAMLDAYSDSDMERYEVSTYVNNPYNEGPKAIQPAR
ncbi:MAG: SOS response-associated peptidase [Candidatus Lokiarchaeota archaeon]|nr:SOS response-associated peptidase [Candidatus Lokiarchaeota archaeon]